MIDPTLEHARMAIYRQMAESIRVAHEINPNSWSVQFYEGRVIVFVSEYTTWLYQRDGSGRLEILLKAPAPSSPVIKVVKDDFRRTDSFGIDLARVSVPHLEFETAWQEVAESHREVVEVLARSVRTRSSRSASFDPAALKEIEDRSGQELPTPAYVNDGSVAAKSSTRYWKVSAGRGNRDWSTFRDGSFIAIGWEEVGHVPDLPADREGFTAGLRRETGVSPAGALALWQFIHGMQIGDRVLSTARGELYGVGTIIGDYELVDDDFPYRHRRQVEWTSIDRTPLDHLSESTASLLSRQATILQLTEAQFTEIVGQRVAHAVGTPAVIPLDVMQRSVRAQGLTYTDQQLATFYAALQTKGFVILSGISGTGKSKLAQAFVGCLPSARIGQEAGGVSVSDITIRVTETNRKHGYFTLPSRQIASFPLPELGKSRPVFVRFGSNGSLGTLSHIEFNGGRNRIARVYPGGVIRKVFREMNVGDPLLLDILLGDDNQIETISIRRPDEEPVVSGSLLADAASMQNNLFLSVRPDWRDSRALLGYHNPLLGSYEWTEFLRFVLRAAENFRGPREDRVAWFVILDEMNLAHVEYYFADLLSVLESGRDAEGLTREAIRIERPDPAEDQDDADVPPAAIRLSPNLYIVGTVNMDETTHAFSPKVLDRAFTIELADVDFSAYPPPRTGDALAAIGDDERRALLDVFSRDGRFIGIDKGEIAGIVDAHPDIRTWLQALNASLARSQMQFGYRVFDEIASFVGAYESVVP